MNAKNQSSLHSAPACATQRGFTLVEIMVVIVILGLLATLVVPNIMGASDEAKETKARTDCKLISGAVRMYYTRNSRLPETLEELATKDDRGRSELEEMPMDPTSWSQVTHRVSLRSSAVVPTRNSEPKMTFRVSSRTGNRQS
jgi:type II secretion system protein G